MDASSLRDSAGIMSGKGDKPRPLGVSREQFDQNWDKVFLKEIPEHDNPLEGGAVRFWEHHCSFNGRHMVQVGHPCNWCGEYEDGTLD